MKMIRNYNYLRSVYKNHEFVWGSRMRSGCITLRVGVDNVFDKRYWASAAGVSGGWLNMGSPRSVSLSAQFEF